MGKICWRRDRLPTPVFLGFSGRSAGKEAACNVGGLGSIPGLGRSPGEGKVCPSQYSGPENSTDCLVYGVAESGMTERPSLTHSQYIAHSIPAVVNGPVASWVLDSLTELYVYTNGSLTKQNSLLSFLLLL